MNRTPRRSFHRAIAIALVAVSLVIPSGLSARAQPTGDDWEIPNGRFFTQARGSAAAGTGYAVTNNDNIPFWTAFQRYGGVAQVGYPVSHRFMWKGFVSQAFQKVVFQHRPDQGGAVVFVNVFDELSAAGKDDWLVVQRQVPKSQAWTEDTGKPWEQVVRNHYALLDRDPAIKDVFLSAPDPVTYNGLPMAYLDLTNVTVIRAQRRVFQRWKIDVPWARAGQVVVANGGDVGKDGGLYPQAAIVPQPPNAVPALVQAATPTPAPTATAVPARTPTPAPTQQAQNNAVNPPAGATPNPLAASCDSVEHRAERSWLQNTEFDGRFNNGVPEGWTSFVIRGNMNFNEDTGREKFGRAGLRIAGTGNFQGGLYQVVNGIKAGNWYHAFYATAQQVWGEGGVKDGSLPTLREVGIDPTGGTDPRSAAIIWGRPVGGQPDKDRGKFGGWKTLGNGLAPLVSFRATGTRATMFIRVTGWPDITRNDTWVDSPFFIDACDR